MTAWRIAIAGAGVAGLTLALALARGLEGAVAVTLYDPALDRAPGPEGRAYAIAAGARRMLSALGVWDEVAPRAQPILDMVITDSRLADPIRPAFLTFEGEVEPGEPFAHMVEGGPLASSLLAACRAAGVRLEPMAVSGFEISLDSVELQGFGQTESAHLLVAADGARSRLREAARIGFVSQTYPQLGLVGTVSHEREHRGRAVEHFLPAGPFALLPLTPGGRLGHRTSIVWTEEQGEAQRVLALDIEGQREEVERRFGWHLGALALEAPLRGYPLSVGLARRFVRPRFALLGDAAHVIHPIAGQGLNLGLADAASLAEAVADAVRLGLDPGRLDALVPYERARRFDSFSMGLVTDGLNRLFSTDSTPVRLLRDFGLGLVDRSPPLKALFIRRAAGLDGEAPRLMRGEAL
jgi:2-octaprenyl-6-methoxyphenol hydroxylase